MSESVLREKINETRLRKVEFSFAHVKQIELKLILCYNKVIDKQEFYGNLHSLKRKATIG
jgi:hypothetical protein